MEIIKGLPQLDIAAHIAAQGFQKELSLDLTEDVGSHLKSGELLYRLVDKDRDIGFAIFSVLENDILYLSGVIIEPCYQRKRLIASLVKQAQSDASNTKYLVLRTQSLRMWVAGSKLCSSWFPNQHSDIPGLLCNKGKIVASYLSSAFPFCHKVYGNPLYGEKPIYHDEALQIWWDSVCSFERGDAVICIGEMY